MKKEIRRLGLIGKAFELKLRALYIPKNPANGTKECIVILDGLDNEVGNFYTNDESDTWADVEIVDEVIFSFHWMHSDENDGEGHSVECYEIYEYEYESGGIFISTDLNKEYILKVIEQT